MVLLGWLPLLCNWRVVIVRSDVGHIIIEWIEAIGSSSHGEIAPSESHIKTDGSIVIDDILYLLSEIFCVLSSPITSPISKPSAINLTSEY